MRGRLFGEAHNGHPVGEDSIMFWSGLALGLGSFFALIGALLSAVLGISFGTAR